LARFILLPAPRPVVAVLSELRSNSDDVGVADNVSEVAEAALVLAAPEIGVPERLFDIVWVAHHGAFSYYDSSGPDSFTLVDLPREAVTTTCAATIC